jgi:hypothetical protein
VLLPVRILILLRWLCPWNPLFSHKWQSSAAGSQAQVLVGSDLLHFRPPDFLLGVRSSFAVADMGSTSPCAVVDFPRAGLAGAGVQSSPCFSAPFVAELAASIPMCWSWIFDCLWIITGICRYSSWVIGLKDSRFSSSDHSPTMVFWTRPPSVWWNDCEAIN